LEHKARLVGYNCVKKMANKAGQYKKCVPFVFITHLFNSYFMKKVYFVLMLLWLAIPASNLLLAQVSITGSDLPSVGTQKAVGITNTPAIDVGAASATAQTWDFTSLVPGSFTLAAFTDPDGLEGSGDFPMANMARTGPVNSLLGVSLGDFLPIDNIPNAVAYYAKNAQGKIYIDGFNVNISLPGILDLGATSIQANPNDLYLTPANYGDVITNSGGYVLEIDFNGTPIALRFNIDKVINVDAFGTLQLPDYNFEVLRYNETNTVGAELGLLVFGAFIPIDPDALAALLGVELPIDFGFLDSTIVTNSYRFIAKNQGYPAASVSMVANPLTGGSSPASVEFMAQPGPLQAEFNYTVNCLTASFTNASANAIGYNWNFGNGEVSTATNPVFTFTEPGTYTVSLTALSADGTSATITKEVTVDFCSDINEPTDSERFSVYPNPAVNTLNIKPQYTTGAYSIALYNTLGQKTAVWSQLNGNATIDISQLPKGIYVYTLYNTNGNAIARGKLAVE